MSEERLIRYICVFKGHRGSRELGLTQFQGGWALCPDILGNNHEWLDIGEAAIADAVQQWREITGLGR